MSKPIHIVIDPKVEEHIRAERLYYSRRSRMAKVDRLVAAALILFGVVGVTTVGIRWWTVMWFVLAPFEFFNLLSLAPIVVRIRFRNTPKFHEKSELTFSETEILYKTPSITSNMKWELYKDSLENDDLILLIYGKNMYSLLPKRCFQSEEDLIAFQVLMRNKIRKETQSNR